MNKPLFLTVSFITLLTLGFQTPLIAAEANVDELLQLVKEGMSKDAASQRERLAQFKQQVQQQDALISAAQTERRNLEQRSELLEKKYAEQEKELAKQQERLIARMGNLKETFGVLQQVAGDTKGVFETSLISSKFENRNVFLDQLMKKASSTSELPSMEELEQLWFEMHQEVSQSGKIEKYTASVTNTEGEKTQQQIVQIGSFNAVGEQGYLTWDAESQTLVELARQPASYMRSSANDMLDANPGEKVAFWLDPSRGSLLSILLKTPRLGERIQQGGVVGYVIIALGVLALIITIERLIKLTKITRSIDSQLQQNQPSENNPLGRIMKAYDINARENIDIEALELNVSEAIAKELPGINRFISWLKIIAAIAPLLGLLGTVTGMINTFEVMALFGTGDPKLMAGGISQALVTTVLGLAIAIPAVLLHTLVNERSKNIIHILEEKALGMLAQFAEQKNSNKNAVAA